VFSKAIELLSKPEVEARLGAIYALEGADLEGADPEGANLHGANLRNTKGANLKGAKRSISPLRQRLPNGANGTGSSISCGPTIRRRSTRCRRCSAIA
jgi:hypothetical protein